MKQDKLCKNCIYWLHHDGDIPVGQCLRHAPVYVEPPKGKLAYGRWPKTGNHDWCGEFKGVPVPKIPTINFSQVSVPIKVR